MSPINGESMFGMNQDCDLHGEDRMRECKLCGTEFCALCFPGSVVCPGCASDGVEDDLDEEDDFDEAHDVDDLMDFEDMKPPASGGGGRAKSDDPDD